MNVKKLLKIKKEKERNDKLLLDAEILIAVMSIAILVGCVISAVALNVELLVKILLISLGTLICLGGLAFSLLIETYAGYYVCKECEHVYIPTVKSVFWAMHFGRTRYMKCPKCNKKSWHKKKIKLKEKTDQPKEKQL